MTANQITAGMMETLSVALYLVGFLAPWLILYHWQDYRDWKRWKDRNEKWWKWLHQD